VVDVPRQDGSLRARCLLELEEEGFISRLPLITWPGVDTNHKVTFVAWVSDSYPGAFDLLVAILQRQLFTLSPFLAIEGNPSSPPSSSVPSKQPAAIDSCTPAMGLIPPSFSKGN